MGHKEHFGHMPDGREIERVTLTGGGLTAKILTYGAVLQDLRLDGHNPALVCGFETFEPYLKHPHYFGSTPGRFSNRIGNAQFELEGKTYKTDANYLGKHTLHGGSQGTSAMIWEIEDLGTSHVDLRLVLPDGHMGFPGATKHNCSIALKNDGNFHIAYVSKSDAKTVAGLTHHSYWRLDGEPDCLDTELQIFADHYLPVDGDLIPTGEIASVAGTPFDFREAKMIESDLADDFFYDHNFCLTNQRRNIQNVATAYSPTSGVSMTVATTEPGLQFYPAHKLEVLTPGLDGQHYGAYAGFCMEAQNWPDAPNQTAFPIAVLEPDMPLRQVTEYRFTKD